MTADLRDEREHLLRSLRDLDAEYHAGDLDEQDYVALRDDYTARAAAVLRRIDEIPGSPVVADVTVDATASHDGRRRQSRTRPRTVVAALLLAAIAAAAGYGVARSSGERLATDQATGNLTEGSVDRITRAQVLTSEGKVLEAIKVYDDLLKDDPQNPVALAERGWLISRVDPALVDRGLAGIDQAIAVDPKYPDAHFFRGMILLQAKNQPSEAAAAFQRGIDANPPPDLLSFLQRFKAQAEEAAATPTTEPSATP